MHQTGVERLAAEREVLLDRAHPHVRVGIASLRPLHRLDGQVDTRHREADAAEECQELPGPATRVEDPNRAAAAAREQRVQGLAETHHPLGCGRIPDGGDVLGRQYSS